MFGVSVKTHSLRQARTIGSPGTFDQRLTMCTRIARVRSCSETFSPDGVQLFAGSPLRSRNAPIGFFVNDRAWSDGDQFEPLAGHDAIDDAEAADAEAAQSCEVVLERLAGIRVGEQLCKGGANLAFQGGVQALDEPGDVRRDRELVDRALHARKVFPVEPESGYLKSSSSV